MTSREFVWHSRVGVNQTCVPLAKTASEPEQHENGTGPNTAKNKNNRTPHAAYRLHSHGRAPEASRIGHRGLSHNLPKHPYSLPLLKQKSLRTMKTSRTRSTSMLGLPFARMAPAQLLLMVLFCLTPSRSFSVDAFQSNSLLTTARSTHTKFPLFYQSEETSILRPYAESQPRSDEVRRQWVDKSLSYYSKVMREERRRNLGQVSAEALESEEYHAEFVGLAKKHYFALRKAKDGKPKHAELIYKKIIHELLTEDDEDCDHAKLAVTTLLLALHLQRSGDAPKKTRSVFLRFFRLVNQREERCACSAKVLVAFALFEMKQGNSLKSLEIVLKAIKLDPTVSPVLNWKQFRDVMDRRRQKQLRARELRRQQAKQL